LYCARPPSTIGLLTPSYGLQDCPSLSLCSEIPASIVSMVTVYDFVIIRMAVKWELQRWTA